VNIEHIKDKERTKILEQRKRKLLILKKSENIIFVIKNNIQLKLLKIILL